MLQRPITNPIFIIFSFVEFRSIACPIYIARNPPKNRNGAKTFFGYADFKCSGSRKSLKRPSFFSTGRMATKPRFTRSRLAFTKSEANQIPPRIVELRYFRYGSSDLRLQPKPAGKKGWGGHPDKPLGDHCDRASNASGRTRPRSSVR
jgi:hypothetical protein